MEFNEFQTQLNEVTLKKYPAEVISELYEYINNVPFIQRLIGKDRKHAKDLNKDKNGKIIVDLSNPHILENMDYFRQSAIHYQKYGCYTKLRVNTSPQSEYMKWFKEEIKRCWYGMVRPEDGEWITGDLYFYLNYFPIIQTRIIKTESGTYGERTVDFPEIWEGVYWRFHYLEQARYGGLYNDFSGNNHAVEIAARGRSKSYSVGAKLVKNFVLGISYKHRRKIKSLLSAYQKEYLIKDGTLNKFVDGINFLAENTQFPSKRLKDSLSDMHWKSGWLDSEGRPKGSENEIIAVAVSDDPDKLRGKRVDFMPYEEFGTYPKFLDVWQTSLPNVQEGTLAFALAYAIGTGGSEGSDFQGAMEMILNPKGYNVYSLPNVYDKGSTGNKDTIFFFPGYVNVKGFYNKDGVSDVIGSMLDELKFRHNLKYNSTDPVQLTRRKAETAFTLQDAVMRRDSTIYPVADLNDRLNEIDNDSTTLNDMYVGRLEIKDGEVVYQPDADLKPILHFPHKDNKMQGAVHIKALPIKESNGKVPWGRYIASLDPVDDDESGSLSLLSCHVLDLWTDDIVAEYTGREAFVEDSYEIIRRLLLFYNSECNYENNKKGFFTYMSKHNCIYLLSDTLEFLKDKDMAKVSYGNKAKGTVSTASVKAYGRRCYRDYLLKPVEVTKVYDGEEQQVWVPNLFRLKYRALIQETSTWNPDGNFDRHDSMIMLMLLREDKLRLLGDSSFEERRSDISNDYLGSDEFFEKNYHGRYHRESEKWEKTMRVLGYMKD